MLRQSSRSRAVLTGAAVLTLAASLAAYGNADASLRALAGVLAGEVKARGKLPVAIPTADGTGEAFPLGHGLG